jgi:cytochrome P450
MFFLGQHPEMQARARAEAISVLETLDDPLNLTMADIQRMPFVTACVRETMRMNSPSTTTLPRISAEALQVGPYLIPPGTAMFVNMYSIGRSEQNWEDPRVFCPERFLSQGFTEMTWGGSSLETWIPFSVGPRRCPAANFAMAEQRTLLAILLSRYTWTVPADSIHATAAGIRNAPSAFALNLPKAVTLTFSPLES